LFTWKPIYREVADKLPEFESKNGQLVQLMTKLHQRGLKVSSVSDENPKGTKVPLDEIDPFSFLAIFNRGVTDENRIAILDALKVEWNLQSELPIDFNGIPLVNSQNSWFMPYKYKRNAEHVGTLWKFYKHVLSISDSNALDASLFDECRALNRVGSTSLTMGMFWCRPELWIAVDKKNRAIAATKGIDFKIKTGAEYLRWLEFVKQKFPIATVDFSYQAHLEYIATDPGEDEDEDSVIDEVEGRNYWLLAPGQGAILWDAWYDQGVGGIGWNDLGDLNDYESKDAIVDYVPQFYPGSGPAAVASMLWEFAHVMKAGDIVFAKLGLHKVCGWGVVSGDYEFDDDSEPFHHVRKIEWKDATELSMPTGVQLPLKTLTRMTAKRQFLDYLARNYDGVPGLEASGDAKPDNSGEGRIAGEPYDLACALEDLFMPPSQVQACVELLKRKKNVILQGAPGTGKTFVAKRLAYLLMERKDNSRVQMVQFHQSLTYEDFVQGYKPSADGGFRLENGTFHKFVTAALSKPKIPFVFIIDEINRGNLSKVLGELMMLIEHDKRSSEFALPLSYCSDPEATFYVPDNVYLIGTMNTADRSLSMVDYALRRRFSFVELAPGFESQAFAGCLIAAGASNALVAEIRHRMSLLNSMILSDETNLGRGYQIGHSYFVPSKEQVANEEWLDHILAYEIKPLVEEYYCDDQAQRSAALDILFGAN
jgi:5-methylcytosine-specific restriction protein B